MATRIVTYQRVGWVNDSFALFKSPGMHGIFPALLQEAREVLIPYLVRIFCACLANGYLPAIWRQVKVVFIPKLSRNSYFGPRDLRPISLTSFLLMTMERLVDRFLRDEILMLKPLHPSQHAYQTGKSVETALHQLVVRVEKALDQHKIALGVFLDMEDTSYDSMCAALTRHGVVYQWIRANLEGQLATATLEGFSRSVVVSKGCPQGGVLSPLLWCLVVNELLARLNEESVYSQGYVDDI